MNIGKTPAVGSILVPSAGERMELASVGLSSVLSPGEADVPAWLGTAP